MKHTLPLYEYINELEPDKNYTEGRVITFLEMHTLRREMQELSRSGFRDFLSYLGCRGLKPAITHNGYILLDVRNPVHLLAIPEDYDFARSPFAANTINLTRGLIYPLLGLPADMYYAHYIRWFPWKNHSTPLRTQTCKLSEVEQERIYVDVPCITPTDNHLQFMRVSQLVFEKMYYTAHGRKTFIDCSRANSSSDGGLHTEIKLADPCPDYVLENEQALYDTHYAEFLHKAKRFVRVQHQHGETARDVSDFLIHL